jgi:hypothetical protein
MLAAAGLATHEQWLEVARRRQPGTVARTGAPETSTPKIQTEHRASPRALARIQEPARVRTPSVERGRGARPAAALTEEAKHHGFLRHRRGVLCSASQTMEPKPVLDRGQGTPRQARLASLPVGVGPGGPERSFPVSFSFWLLRQWHASRQRLLARCCCWGTSERSLLRRPGACIGKQDAGVHAPH